MPPSDSHALAVFISYATEDSPIAEALKLALKTAFGDDIAITMMSEFAAGLNYKQLIQKSISETDLMIAIATGRLKPSHSFTGAEVGAFEQSVYEDSKMERWPQMDRRMIPFAVLARVPATIDEFQGINIDRNALRDVRFDPAPLGDNLKRLKADRDASQPNLLKFLLDVQQILNLRYSSSQLNSAAVSPDRLQILTNLAVALTEAVLTSILSKEKETDIPKAKLSSEPNQELHSLPAIFR